MQQWYGLSDPAMEDVLYDIESMRRFADIDMEVDVIPDETTILNFRHLLEKHELTQKIFEKTKQYLSEKGLLLREGTIVDATIISAPSSTKNPQKTAAAARAGQSHGSEASGSSSFHLQLPGRHHAHGRQRGLGLVRSRRGRPAEAARAGRRGQARRHRARMGRPDEIRGAKF